MLGAHLLARHALDMGALWQVCSLGLTKVSAKVHRTCSVVNTDLHVIVPGTLYNQPLHVVVGGELGQRQQALHRDRLVHLSNLFKKPDQGHVSMKRLLSLTKFS